MRDAKLERFAAAANGRHSRGRTTRVLFVVPNAVAVAADVPRPRAFALAPNAAGVRATGRAIHPTRRRSIERSIDADLDRRGSLLIEVQRPPS
eukprot:31157-Pelagococcus_subviridis.AAC.7